MINIVESAVNKKMNQIQQVLDNVVASLTEVLGIQAVVLGGSRARGTHSPDSDIDIGIYYDNAALDLAALNKAAQRLDDQHRQDLIVPPGEWGNWVNGGGWLMMDGYHVDFILRDVQRVDTVMKDCQQGRITAHYQTGHPHAFINAMYMGELAICSLLWDKQGDLLARKVVAEQYPPKMKKAILDFFGFEAGFSLMLAEGSANKQDAYYVTAHIVRAISALNQVLFAANQQYCLNEKKAVGMIEGFGIHPQGYSQKVQSILAQAATHSTNACAKLKQLIGEVKNLLAEYA